MQPPKTEASPWTEPEVTASNSSTPHWRSSVLYRGLSPEEFRDFEERTNVLPVYVAAYGGTVIAGALFPIVAMAFAMVAWRGQGPRVGEVLVLAPLAALMGGFIAAIAGGVVLPLFALLQWMAVLHRWRVVFASCAGGWSGFASVVTLFLRDISRSDDLGMAAIFSAAAMLVGQLGAALMAGRAARLVGVAARLEAAPHRRQMPLRQLFGITTAVALAVVMISSLPLPPIAFTMLAAAAVAQAVLVATVLAIRAMNRSLSRGENRYLVSRETLAEIEANFTEPLPLQRPDAEPARPDPGGSPSVG